MFRDDNYSIDSKSRLSAIEPEIALDADELLRALKDAIKNSKKKAGNTMVKSVVSEPNTTPTVQEEDIEELPFEEDVLDETEGEGTISGYPDNLDTVIRKMFKECTDSDLKASVREVISEYGKLNDVDREGLEKIYDMMK